MALPVIIGGYIIMRTAAGILLKVRTGRFNHMKERFPRSTVITNPTTKQFDKAQILTGKKEAGTYARNFPAKDRGSLMKEDTSLPSRSQTYTGTGRTPGQEQLRGVRTGEMRRGRHKAEAAAVGAAAVGAAAGYAGAKASERKRQNQTRKADPLLSEYLAAREDKEGDRFKRSEAKKDYENFMSGKTSELKFKKGGAVVKKRKKIRRKKK